jgi:CubicO group peptidase (beta-lactamase class C family)
MRVVATWAVLATLTASISSAQLILGGRDSLTGRVDSVFARFDRTDSPGCAVGVYRGGAIVYARGYGMANLELGVPITPRTVLDVGSVSKQFTAATILLLEAEGRLSLDDPVRRHVPELGPWADRVSLRRMLSMTGGLRDYLTLWSIEGRSFEAVADTADFMRLISRTAATNFEPGTRYLYSNSGYVLAGQIVYRLTGRTLAQFARERIFDSLGMRETFFHDDHRRIIPNRAQGYSPRRGGGFQVQMSQFDGTGGAGSVHTTVEDLLKWAANYDSARVGGRRLVEALQTPSQFSDGRPAADGQFSAYALGLSVGTFRGLRVAQHGGAWAGYRAHFLRFPDEGLTVACLCNVTNAGPDSLARKVAAVYLDGRMSPDTLGAWASALVSAPAVAVAAEQLRRLEGTYKRDSLGDVRRVRLVGDSLMVGTAERTRLVPLGGDRFRVGRQEGEARFEGDSAGLPTRLVLRGRGGESRWRRVPPFTLTAAQLAEYAGEYATGELDVTWTFRPDSNGLALWVDGRRRAVMESVYRDAFTDNSSGLVDFVRDQRGRVVAFVLQAGRVRDLRFDRRAGAVAGAAPRGAQPSPASRSSSSREP